MKTDILNQTTQARGHYGELVNIADLPEYAKNNCKKCYGKGYLKMVKNVNGEWVLDRYDICTCVLKSKYLLELWEKIKKASEEKSIEINSETELKEVTEEFITPEK